MGAIPGALSGTAQAHIHASHAHALTQTEQFQPAPRQPTHPPIVKLESLLHRRDCAENRQPARGRGRGPREFGKCEHRVTEHWKWCSNSSNPSTRHVRMPTDLFTLDLMFEAVPYSSDSIFDTREI